MQALPRTRQHALMNRQIMKRYLICVLVETRMGKVGVHAHPPARQLEQGLASRKLPTSAQHP